MAAPEEPSTAPEPGRRPPVDVSTVVFVVSSPITRADIPLLCERVRALLDGCDADVVACDVGRVLDADAVTVDALARIQLTARRAGRAVLLRNACGELRGLLSLTGLSDVIPTERRNHSSS